MKLRRVIFPVLMLLLVLFLLSPQDSIAYDREADVDWEAGVIIVEGFGVPPEDVTQGQARLLAQRAAKTDAYRNAAEYIDGIQVDSETVVQDYVVESDDVRTQVEGFIKGGEFISVEYGPDNICQVELKVPLQGQGNEEGLDSFFESSVQERRQKDSREDIEQYLERAEDRVEESDERLDGVERTSEYTGVIIDARGLNVEPALYPQIFDSEGYSLYGPNSVGPDNPSDVSSLVAYARDKSRAKEIDRLGENPIVIDAVSVIERDAVKPTDLIVGSKAAEIINELKTSNQLAERRAVAILID